MGKRKASPKNTSFINKTDLKENSNMEYCPKDLIPSFNPEEGLKYSQWLKVFNQQIKLRNIKQEDALFMIPTLFKGNALEIYATICDEIDTLEDLHSRMMTFFPELERGLHKKFWQLTKQETQSVRGYYFEKVKIGTQLHMPKDLVLESLTSGAGPLEKFLIASSPHSLEDWLRIAESLEHTTQQRDGRWNNGRRNNFAGGNRPNMASRWRSITPQHGDVNAGQLHEPGHPGTSSIGLQSKTINQSNIYFPSCFKSRPIYQPNFRPLPLPNSEDSYIHNDVRLGNNFHVLMNDYDDIFGENKYNVRPLKVDPPRLTLRDKTPVCLRPYRHNLKDNETIKEQISQLLKYGIIKPASSPYSSPVTLARKKGESDKTRLCIDFRKLNSKLIGDSFPIPLIENIIQKVQGSKVFSCLDILSAYWTVSLHEKDQYMTCFTTTEGSYQWCRLPFGLRTAPAIFNRILSSILQKYDLKNVISYFDDILVFSNDTQSHLEHLKEIFEILQEEGIQLRKEKCLFFMKKINHLGYEIFGDQMSPSGINVDIIKSLPPPRNVRCLRSFLGSVTHIMLSLGGVLKQEYPDGTMKPIAFYSRALRGAESKYTITELELLAIIETCKRYHPYISGQRVIVHTDHKALIWLNNFKHTNGRLFRWSLRLSEYDLEFKYNKGCENYEADMLSRLPYSCFLSIQDLKEGQESLAKPSSKLYFNKDNITYIRLKNKDRVVVPPSLQQELIIKAHESLGHPGISAMARVISTQYYFKGMIGKIKNYILKCKTCQSVKKPTTPSYGLMGTLPLAEKPFDVVALDSILGLGEYNSTKNCLHVVVDHHSRYIWAFPSKSTSIATYMNIINQLLSIGKPKIIVTDRHPSFVSKRFNKFIQEKGIKHVMTSPSHPQCNGLVERANATIISKLRLHHQQNPRIPWHKLLQKALEEYRNTPHSITTIPPVYLLFGIDPFYTSDLTIAYPPIEEARKTANDNTKKLHLKLVKRYNESHKAPNLKIGDKVLYKIPYQSGQEMEDDHRPTVSGSYLPCQRQRDPSTFSGDGNINPGQWLKEYERVSKYNRWDETMKLANVVFYLNGTAGRWFDNNEESLNSWRSFEDAFRGVFGLQEDSARRAEEVLKSRAQKAEESSESYIQEILSLCHQVNPRMEEGERVAHIIKGISEDTYQVLVAKDIQRVDEILKFCRHLTTVKQRRIGRTKFARLSNVMPISCVDDSDDLAALIRRIVREEIQKVFSAPEVINPLREVNALEQTVREEVSRALQPTRPQVNVVQQQPRTPYYNIDRPTQPRKTEHWRTHDDKPICFHCGRPGHVVRYCRERRQVFAEARSRNGGEGRNPRKVASPKTIPVASPSFQPFSHASECEKLSGAASNGGKVAIEENPPGYIAAKLKENFVMVEINGRKIKALVDSGADFSVISDKFRRELKTPLFKEPGPILKAANKNLIETLGKCVLNIEVNGLNISFEFVVMVECSHDIIFGWDFFKATEAVIDCGRNELHLGETSVLESREEENQRLFASDDFVIPPKSIKKISVINEEICGVRDVLVSTSKDLLLRKEVLIPNSLVTFRHGRGSIWVANGASWPQLIPSGMNMCTMESYENGNICNLIESSDKLQETQLKSSEWSQKINLTLDPGLSEIQRLQLVSCLDEFIGIFDFGSTPIKPTSTVKHKINTGDQSPIKQRPYRVAPSERRLIQDEVNKMIENHIVKPSESPWSSPVILVRKKDGTWRFCVDYRRLNKITKKDVYPLPRIDDALDSLAGSSYFSTMDLRSGYWQIEVDEKDREKTAFITPDGLYEFQVMPFGLCNAPATFERMIDSVLGSLKWNMCLCYLDDIVVYAPTFEEHLRRLQLVLSCIQKAGLSLNHKKCLFGSRRIKILGHLVDANGIHPDPDKVEAVSKFPRPRNISELKSFLGLCSYYRRFIENFAGKARSLHDLLKTEKQFYWDAAQEKAFEVLKTALISEPVLGHFDESADTHLHTDASGHGIGAVLLQIQGGKERPIAYASRSLTKAENNYSTTEKECLAVVWSISKFRPYLFGRPFTVVTDHHSLCWLVGQKDPSGRLARWALKLQEFDVTVIYKSGRKHKDADCLSRSPLENDQPSAVMSLTSVDIEQTKDPDLAKIIDNLNSGYTRKEFSIIDGILYKKNYSTTGRPWLMMIPKHLRSEVMADLHDAPTAGHLGFARTYDKVKKRFYWPGLYRTVRQYVSHCRECQRRKKLPRRPAGKLVSIPPVEKPFYKVGVDLLGRFPVSKDGNRWIIVCTDYMTRYAITKAIPDGGAIETAKFLVEDVILKHGAPREMITDRGRNFISQVIKEINALCGIVHRFTTAYHPQTNGLTERFNKTLGDMLSMYTGVEQKDWDQVLPYVTFAYNTAKQEATGYTPFFLVHAREAETYIDAVLPYLPDEISNDYVGELVTRAEEARQLSRSRLLQSQAKDRRLYDQKHTPVYYQKDDLVWVFTPIRKVGLSEKLLKRYFGPYKVTKKLSEVTYEIEPVDPSPRSRKAKDIVHVIRMKPYLDPEEQHSILLGNTSLPGLDFKFRPDPEGFFIASMTTARVGLYVCSAMPDALHDVFWARWRILTFGATRKDRRVRHETRAFSQVLSMESSNTNRLKVDYFGATLLEECSICLDDIKERAFPECCQHQFCLECLKEAAKRRHRCPICRGVFERIVYNVRGAEDFDTVRVELTDPIEDTLDIFPHLIRVLDFLSSSGVPIPNNGELRILLNHGPEIDINPNGRVIILDREPENGTNPNGRDIILDHEPENGTNPNGRDFILDREPENGTHPHRIDIILNGPPENGTHTHRIDIILNRQPENGTNPNGRDIILDREPENGTNPHRRDENLNRGSEVGTRPHRRDENLNRGPEVGTRPHRRDGILNRGPENGTLVMQRNLISNREPEIHTHPYRRNRNLNREPEIRTNRNQEERIRDPQNERRQEIRANLHPVQVDSSDPKITAAKVWLGKQALLVCSAYWHHDTTEYDFLPILESIITTCAIPSVLGMDANAHSPTWGLGAVRDARGASLEASSMLTNLHFLGAPVQYTWSNGHQSSSIDVTLASSSLAARATRTCLPEMAFTDHLPILTTIQDTISLAQNTSWAESTCVESAFTAFLGSSLQHAVSRLHAASTHQDIDDVVHILTKILQKACNISMKRKKKDNRPSKPWWNKDLAKLRNVVVSLRRLSQYTSTPIRNFFKGLYRACHNRLRAEIRRAKHLSWINLCQEVSSAAWSSVHKYISKGRSTQRGPPLLKKSDGTPYTPEETCEKILQHFCLPDTPISQPRPLIQFSGLIEPDFTDAEVLRAIKCCGLKKSPGPDRLGAKCLQLGGPPLHKLLAGPFT
ncbi:hypothetical protein LAZ67_2001503, partial [Cordylochernes scorpioides]